MPPETKRLTLQQFNSTYFGQLFVIYCNKICELIADTYKIFKTVNCLLQQYVYIYIYLYHCIKVAIKIFGVYCNKSFCCTNLLPQILLQHLVSTIKMNLMLLQRFFFCCNKLFFSSCNECLFPFKNVLVVYHH